MTDLFTHAGIEPSVTPRDVSRDASRYPAAPGYKERTTSKEAAEKIAPIAANIRGRVLRHFQNIAPGGCTADEAAAALNLSILTVRPRVSELHKSGLIEPTEERGMNASAMTARVWRAVQGAA